MAQPLWLEPGKLFSGLTPDDGERLLQLAGRLHTSALNSLNSDAFLRQGLTEVAGEVGATAAAVVRRTPHWEVAGSHGRFQLAEIPGPVLAEVLDRGRAHRGKAASATPVEYVVIPFQADHSDSSLLVVTGRTLPEDALPVASLAAQALLQSFSFQRQQSQLRRQISDLRAVLRISTDMANAKETQPLLEQIAKEATRLLECDRASIFIWDRSHQQVVACPALGVEGGILRLSDKVGIVGEVLQSGRLVRVDDVSQDARFNQKVDQSSGYRTQNLLCCPLTDAESQMIGAFEVLNKKSGVFTAADEQTLQELAAPVTAALQQTRERESLIRSQKQLKEQVTKGVNLIGESQPIVAMRTTIRRLAETDLPVLVLGESGTGKEVVAQSLHYQGPRAEKPFVAVNCAALTETLLESELFGHEKGSFTDAHEMRRGKFELAEGGTIFLDEIGDMSPGGQAKLLRVLEQRVITRVGGSQTIPINTRVIAATNAHLAEAVRARRFREDLYYRLNVVTLDLPPLRDRPDDVVPLAEFFLSQFAPMARRHRLSLSAEAKKRLQAHHWPGNVRELRNLMERVAFLAQGERVEAEDLAFILSPDRDSMKEPSLDGGLAEATTTFQQEYIRRAIKRVRNNMSEAARLLGLHRSNLYRKMRQLGMSEAGLEDMDIEG